MDNGVIFKKLVQHALSFADSADIFRGTVGDKAVINSNRNILKMMLMNDEGLWQMSEHMYYLSCPVVLLAESDDNIISHQ